MRYLNFKVSAQVLEKDGDFSNLVPGTEGYLVATFEFSEEWSGCVKVASFFNRRGEEYAERIINNRCKIPSEVLKDRFFKVQVVGQKQNYKILTDKLKIRQEGC